MIEDARGTEAVIVAGTRTVDLGADPAIDRTSTTSRRPVAITVVIVVRGPVLAPTLVHGPNRRVRARSSTRDHARGAVADRKQYLRVLPAGRPASFAGNSSVDLGEGGHKITFFEAIIEINFICCVNDDHK